ncbi:MAG TPA: autotransporter domain-containing protein [Caulobacteraceae bacterium]
MMRRSLVAAVAVAPLLAVLCGQAYATTSITTATTTPVATATAGDVTIAAGGSISPTANTAPAVTVNSSNTVSNAGTISFKDLNNTIGIEVLGAQTGQVTNTGTISITETYAATDTNSDGVVDGVFSKQTGGAGVLVTGGLFTGGITNTGSITVQGNGAVGISIDSHMTGSLLDLTVSPLPITSTSSSTLSSGTISVTGNNAIGVSVTANGQVGGDVKLGAVSAQGVGAKAVSIQGDVGGMLLFNGAVSSTGYRTVSPTTTAATLATYTADELQQGGGTVVIGANIGNGILVTAAPTTADTTHPDADGNGIPDANQAGSIVAYGSAPAVQIGTQGSTITVGHLTVEDTTYGFLNQGSITASGVYNKATAPNLPAPVSATAIQIGVTGGTGSATIVGGMHNTGTIAASALGADATDIFVTTGGVVPTIVNGGTIVSAVTNNLTTAPTSTPTSHAILIDAGGNVASLVNTGTIAAATAGTIAPTVAGTIGAASAIVDESGSLLSVSNTGVISATVTQTVTPTTTADSFPNSRTAVTTAIDLSKATSDATITQSLSSVTGAAAPSIVGAIKFGSGADTLTVTAGTVAGAISFGDGADILNINGDATATKVTGAITDSDGQLTLNVTKGVLSDTNAQKTNVTAVNVGASGTVLISADPTNNTNTDFVTTGASTIGAGATFGLTLQTLQTSLSQSYTVIETQVLGGVRQGSISASTFGAGQLTDAPFFFAASTSYQAGATASDADKIVLTVTRKTASELGFNHAESAAYDQVFNALLKDAGIQKAILAQTTRSGLITLYDQMLPDQGQGVFDTLDQAAQSISSLTAQTPDAGTRVAGTSLWLQEVNERVKRRSGDTLGSHSQMFGLVGGYEHMGAGGGALGATFSYLNVQDRDSAAAVGEHTVASLLEVGGYYRRAVGGLRISARGAGGYAFFHEDRQFISTGVSRRALSHWGAFFADSHVGAAYEVHLGRFYARPEVSADYLFLRENGHTETGGGDGFDLSIASRSSHRLSGEAIVTLGTQFGRDTWLRPEIRGGYRRIFSGDLGDTVAQFTSSSTPFTLGGAPDTGGWYTVGFSLKGGTNLSYLAIEGDADFRSGEQRYDLFLSGRSMF